MNTASRVNPQRLTQLPKPGKNPAYLRFIHNQPCCVTGKTWTVEAAHTGPRGLSQRANDLDAIPLIRSLHRTGPTALHRIGPVAFQKFYKISIPEVIRELQERARQQGINLEPEPKRKGLARAGFSKTRSVGRCG